MSQPRDTEEGPPRTEGVVPLPRSERGGKRRSRSGGEIDYNCASLASIWSEVVMALEFIS